MLLPCLHVEGQWWGDRRERRQRPLFETAFSTFVRMKPPDIFDKTLETFPSVFVPESNQIITALLQHKVEMEYKNVKLKPKEM